MGGGVTGTLTRGEMGKGEMGKVEMGKVEMGKGEMGKVGSERQPLATRFDASLFSS